MTNFTKEEAGNLMKKKLTKILACILCISTIVSSIPITSSAEETSDVNAISEESTSVVSQGEAVIVSEIQDKRSADTKTFLLSDGSYLHAVYPEQVHYRENNEWVDVDNSFESASDEEGEEVLENEKNSFKIKFSNKAKDKKLVSLKSGQYQIDWALKDASKVEAQSVTLDSSSETEASLQNVNSGVIYKDVLPNVDLQYVIDASSVKEDIILKNNAAQHEFTFDYQVKKLTYKENSDGSISFYAEDNLENAVYTMGKPFMYDANGETSSNITVVIKETNKGFSLELNADSEWLNSSERAYPVTIDPTIVTQQSASVVKDTTGVLSNKTDELYEALETDNNNLWLKVGKFFGTRAYTLIYVPLPSDISESCRIIEAKLNLISYRAGISTCSDNLTISVNEITSDWDQNTISNNEVLYGDNLPEYDYQPTDFMMLNDSSSATHNQLYSFDITRLA